MGDFVVENFDTYTCSGRYIGIRLLADPNTAQGIYLDNIIWEAITPCSEVTNLTAVPSATTATISWTAGSSSETSYQVAVGLATVTDPNTLTPQNTTATTLLVENLTPVTAYKAWVRAICGTDIGNWELINFTTTRQPSDIPYIQNFETAVTPELPSCTSSINVGFGNNWSTQNRNNSGFSSNVLRNPMAPGSTMDAWFFTNGVNLVAGEAYQISYLKGTNSTVSFHNLKVTIGNDNNVAAMTTILATHERFSGNASLETIPFTVTTSGVYYFSFHGYSTGSGTLYIDNISVDLNLSTASFSDSNLQYYPNPVKDILHIDSNQNITSLEIYNVFGQRLVKMAVDAKNLTYNMSDFASGAYIIKAFEDNNEVKIFKVIKN